MNHFPVLLNSKQQENLIELAICGTSILCGDVVKGYADTHIVIHIVHIQK